MFCIIRVRVHAHVLVVCYVATVNTASDTIATSIKFGDWTKCCCNPNVSLVKVNAIGGEAEL